MLNPAIFLYSKHPLPKQLSSLLMGHDDRFLVPFKTDKFLHVAGTGLSTIQLIRSEVSVNNPVPMTSYKPHMPLLKNVITINNTAF